MTKQEYIHGSFKFHLNAWFGMWLPRKKLRRTFYEWEVTDKLECRWPGPEITFSYELTPEDFQPTSFDVEFDSYQSNSMTKPVWDSNVSVWEPFSDTRSADLILFARAPYLDTSPDVYHNNAYFSSWQVEGDTVTTCFNTYNLIPTDRE